MLSGILPGLIGLILFSKTANGQALLLAGEKSPYILHQLAEPFARLDQVDSVKVLSSRHLAIQKTGELGFGLYTTELKRVGNQRASEIGEESEGWIPFRIGEKWGMADTLGNIRLKPKYDGIGLRKENLVSVLVKAHWGFVDLKGKWALKPKLAGFLNSEKRPSFVNGSYTDVLNNQLIVNTNGKITLQKLTNRQEPFYFKHSWKFENSTYQLIDNNEKPVLVATFSSIGGKPRDVLRIVSDSGNYGIVNMISGKLIFNPTLTEPPLIQGSLCGVKTQNGWTLIDSSGITCKLQYFDQIKPGEKDVFIFYTGEESERWAGLLEKGCAIIIPGTYKFIGAFNGGFAVCSRSGAGFTYLTPDGDEINSKTLFDAAEPAICGIGVVKAGNQWLPLNLANPLQKIPITFTDRKSFRIIPLLRLES